MATQRKHLTRRAALAGLAGLGGLAASAPVGVAHAQKPPRPLEGGIPINGKAGPGLKPFDPAMLAIMDRHGIPGAALAIAKAGKLVLAKGYGWANVDTDEPVRPDTLFGLASLSKAITAVATLLLVEQGKLGLDERVLGFVKHIKPPRGARMDPRLRGVTVRQCLNHSGGWDRTIRGDPLNWQPQACRILRARPPLSPRQLLSVVFGVPLDFDPGTRTQYSNVGFMILGEVIAKVSGQPYERFVVENVLKPMGIRRASLHGLDGKYGPHEAHRHLAGTLIELPAANLPMVDAAGGWTASVVDMVRFLTNLDGSRGKPVLGERMRKQMLAPPPRPIRPHPDGTWFGLGWDRVQVKGEEFGYFKDGSLQGMRTFMRRLPTGVSWALLYNASMEFDPHDLQLAAGTVQEVRQLVERFDKYPDVDFFKDYP
jgi:N-acyl-D-amino-acid deacylase